MPRFSRAVEKAIFDRDKGICKICGRDTEFDDGEVEHKISRANGGSDDPENLQWACHRCNKIKGSKLTNEQVRKILRLPESFDAIMKLRQAEKSTSKRTLKNTRASQANLKHSRNILLTRADYQGLENWDDSTLIENLLTHSKDKLETKCLMQHFETGYRDNFWIPLMKYHELWQKYEHPIVPLPSNFRKYSIGYEPSLIEPFGRIPENDKKQMQELKVHLLDTIDKIIFGVKNGIPLNGECEFCPNIR